MTVPSASAKRRKTKPAPPRDGFPKTWGPVTVNNQLRLARMVLKYSNDIAATDRPIGYAHGLKAVSKTVTRRHAASKPAKEFTPLQVHQMIAVAKPTTKAFVLLGLNAGYGVANVSRLLSFIR